MCVFCAVCVSCASVGRAAVMAMCQAKHFKAKRIKSVVINKVQILIIIIIVINKGTNMQECRRSLAQCVKDLHTRVPTVGSLGSGARTTGLAPRTAVGAREVRCVRSVRPDGVRRGPLVDGERRDAWGDGEREGARLDGVRRGPRVDGERRGEAA